MAAGLAPSVIVNVVVVGKYIIGTPKPKLKSTTESFAERLQKTHSEIH